MNLLTLPRIALLVLLGAGALLIQAQHRALSDLKQANWQASTQNAALTAQLSQVRMQADAVAAALAAQAQRHQQQEKAHHALRRQIRELLVQNDCAHQPVPAAVIRLQRDATETSAMSSDLVPTHLLQACPLPAFEVKNWGDYPDYVAQLQLALDRCNSDKAAIRSLLPTTRAP